LTIDNYIWNQTEYNVSFIHCIKTLANNFSMVRKLFFFKRIILRSWKLGMVNYSSKVLLDHETADIPISRTLAHIWTLSYVVWIYLWFRISMTPCHPLAILPVSRLSQARSHKQSPQDSSNYIAFHTHSSLPSTLILLTCTRSAKKLWIAINRISIFFLSQNSGNKDK
jgi:hypothetical protein